MKVEFLKDGNYNWKNYKKGDIIEMSENDIKAYLACKVVKLAIITVKKETSYEKLSYRKLQQLCKKNNIPAVGTKDDLIDSLNKKEVV